MKPIKYLIPCLLILWAGSSFTTVHEKVSRRTDSFSANEINIRVIFNNCKPGDTINLLYYRDLLTPVPGPLDIAIQKNAIVQSDHSFSFRLQPDSKYGYITIRRKNNTDPASQVKDFNNLRDVAVFSYDELIHPLLVEQGDSFTINIVQQDLHKLVKAYGNLRYSYSGAAGRKYKVMQQADSVLANTEGNGAVIDTGLVYNPGNSFDTKIKAALQVVEHNSDAFDPGFYDRLRADIYYGTWKRNRDYYIMRFYRSWVSRQDTVTKTRFRNVYFDIRKRKGILLPEDALLGSKEYTDYLRRKAMYDSEIANGSPDIQEMFDSIKNEYSGAIRDKLMVDFFLHIPSGGANNFNSLMDSAAHMITGSYYRLQLRQLYERRPGAIAYDFALPDTSGKIIRLSDFRGKIVFIDFWYTGCGNCTEYYQNDLSKTEQYFKGNPNVVFISVSIDRTKDFWEKSIHSGLYTSPEIVNLYTGGKAANAPVIDRYNVTGYPHPLIIGRSGKIIADNDREMRKSAVLISMLKAALGAEN